MTFVLAIILAATAGVPPDLQLARHEFFEAQRKGDRAAIERLLAPDFTFVHSTGVVDNRQEFLDRARPGEQPRFLDESIRVYGGTTAICVSRSTVGEMNFRGTDVFVKIDGAWKIAAVHSTRLPTKPNAVAVSPEVLDRLTGEYTVAPGRILIITRHENGLEASVPGLRQKELIPVSETEFVWFSPDSNVDMRLIFHPHAVTLQSDGVEKWTAPKQP